MRNGFGFRSVGLSLLLAFTACSGPADDAGNAVSGQQLELDEMGKAPEGMELFVLAEGASVARVRETFERLSGTLVHHLPPRLVVGKLPAGADALLLESGVVSRFARAVSPSELPGLDTREARFVRVFSSRYYPATTARGELVQPTRRVRAEGEPFETSDNPSAPPMSVLKASLPEDENAEANERNVFVPYASGRIVVSVILPESNGRGEPSTEDWSDASIAEVYAKVQAGLEVIQRHEPNADLSFVLHYESAPAEGGLEGTVDVDYEYGKQHWGSAYLGATYAQIFSRVMEREVYEWNYWEAQNEYLAGLKDQYAADGAFIVYVAANQNFTAGFRAYASIGGPSTSLDSSYGYEVFAHEFGHIFGALDEYCPDACIPPSSLHGYLGIVNANAQYRPGTWGGVRGGKGESQGSLMMYNITNGLNGYTRGAFGWLDTDGDGVIEVRDTLPSSDVRVEVEGSEARLVGRIVDVPATSNWSTPYSVNRIRAVQLRARGTSSWVSVPVESDRRGREDVDIALGALPAGHYELEVRGENSVGNLQPTPALVSFDVAGDAENATPLVSLSSDLDVLSPSGVAGVTASVLDLDADSVKVRFDVDGDGRYDTPFSSNRRVWVTPRRAGLLSVGVEARDARGATSAAVKTLYVLEQNAPALPGLPLAPSPVFGSPRHRFAAVGEVNDPERKLAHVNYKLERDDYLRSLVRETGYGPPRAHVFDVELPGSLPFEGFDMTQFDPSIDRWTSVTDAVRFGNYMAFALGEKGVAFFDLTNRAAPRLVTRLQLQASAQDLALVGGRTLFAVGDSKLTAVDVSNPEQPVEILQQNATYETRITERRDTWNIGEGSVSPLSLWTWFQEDIDGVRVDIGLDHPSWDELRVTLVGPGGQSIVLWDHAPGAAGQTRILLDEEEHEALQQLLGTRPVGEFRLEVVDDVLNGSTGTITHAQLAFDTVHRAYSPGLYHNIHSIAGNLGERSLVLSGSNLVTVDIRDLEQLVTDSVLLTTYVHKAHVIGDKVIAAAQPEDWSGENRPRGLMVVNAANPQSPVVERFDASVRGDAAFALAGTRFYTSSWQEGTTRVGSLASLLAGQPYWLGQSSIQLSNDISGDDSVLWRAYGAIERIDVRNPDAMQVLERFDDPQAYTARFLDARTALLLNSAGELYFVDLASRVNLISELYRFTAQARDAQGAVAEVSRSVHVVPYNHVPVLASARFVRATTTRDPYELEVSVVDPDNHPVWDPYTAVRIDWDGDGIYDGNWQTVWDTQVIQHFYTEPGDYVVRVQARDGYHALSNELTVPVHVELYEPVVCDRSSDCPNGEICDKGTDRCDQQGICAPPAWGCQGFPNPVCSCEGQTYRNICELHAAGATLGHWGVCPGEVTACGGPEDTACSVPGMFCRYPMGATPEESCGAQQAHGECVFPPDICWRGSPVCGCDGTTYATACTAEVNRVSVQHWGACVAPE
jgi:hypothetical protein